MAGWAEREEKGRGQIKESGHKSRKYINDNELFFNG